jgi:hypothetical protein
VSDDSKFDMQNSTSEAEVPPSAGLCADCRHGRALANRRGSVFVLCERSRADDSFPRYPRLPVSSCRGYERRART